MEELNTKFVLLTLDNAEEFFKLCIEKEAVTAKERLAILEQMKSDGKTLVDGVVKGSPDEFANEMAKHMNVLKIDQKGKHHERPTD